MTGRKWVQFTTPTSFFFASHFFLLVYSRSLQLHRRISTRHKFYLCCAKYLRSPIQLFKNRNVSEFKIFISVRPWDSTRRPPSSFRLDRRLVRHDHGWRQRIREGDAGLFTPTRPFMTSPSDLTFKSRYNMSEKIRIRFWKSYSKKLNVGFKNSVH